MRSPNQKILILGSGFAGVGKTTHLSALSEELQKRPQLKCVYLDKDVIAATLLGNEEYFTEYYDKYVHHQQYQLMINLAREHLKLNNVVILDGLFGDKIDQYVKPILSTPGFDVKLIHFHCSGERQLQRLQVRSDPRDAKKVNEFRAYRHKQVQNYLGEMSKISQYCLVDTESDSDLIANLQQIIQYLESSLTVQMMPSLGKSPPLLSEADSMQGMARFKLLLNTTPTPDDKLAGGKLQLETSVAVKDSLSQPGVAAIDAKQVVANGNASPMVEAKGSHLVQDSESMLAFKQKLMALSKSLNGAFEFSIKRQRRDCLLIQFKVTANTALMTPQEITKELMDLVIFFNRVVTTDLAIKPESYKVEPNWHDWTLTMTADVPIILDKINQLLISMGGKNYHPFVAQPKAVFSKSNPQLTQSPAAELNEDDQLMGTCLMQ